MVCGWGLYHIALGLGRLLKELGIPVNLNADVSEVRQENGHVTGLVANGTFHAADIVVSNMEVIPAYEKLLREDKTFIASLEKKYEPACSGLVLDLGLDESPAAEAALFAALGARGLRVRRYAPKDDGLVGVLRQSLAESE